MSDSQVIPSVAAELRAADVQLPTPTSIDWALTRIDPRWSSLLSATEARRLRALVLSRVHGQVMCATSSAEPERVRRAVESRIDLPLQLLSVDDASLRRAIARVYGSPVLALQSPGEPAVESVALLDEVEAAAALRNASDVHIVPSATSTSVQLRVDGVLEDFRELATELHPPLVNRIKVLAGLDIAEKRLPQDGRYTTAPNGHHRGSDVRVATIPTRHGERVTMRILSPLPMESLGDLGMSVDDEPLFQQAILQPSGMILLTGPTGSGKSTTLLAAIEQIKRVRGGNIITVEDPIEYDIPGTTQVEVDSQHKTGFAEALRSILRHDPDIIVLGEIRDQETAELAIRASLTGHLVLSTLHTNSATGAITRLIDMGIEPYLVSATLRLAIAQRLVRQLCKYCRRTYPLASTAAEQLAAPDQAGMEVYAEYGCLACAGKGFTGRSGLFELLPVTEDLRDLIDRSASESQLQKWMLENGRRNLLADGLAKILAGTTTVQQVLSVVEHR